VLCCGLTLLCICRLAKGRDVWESAMLQNANTKCNAILPIWGPEVNYTNEIYARYTCTRTTHRVHTLYYLILTRQVPEAQFETCLSHHTNQLQAVTGWYVHSFNLFLHNLKLLLLRFAHEQSFSVDSGGGGPQSNMFFLPYVLHVGLYLLNTLVV